MDVVTLGIAVWVVRANGVGVLSSVKKLVGVFMEMFGDVSSTLVPVVRIVYSQVLYAMPSVVALVNVADGGLVVFTLKRGLLVLTIGVV